MPRNLYLEPGQLLVIHQIGELLINLKSDDVRDWVVGEDLRQLQPVRLLNGSQEVSDISGKAALIILSARSTFRSTVEELDRFLHGDLRPEEFFAMRYTLRLDLDLLTDSCYDPKSGRAKRPRRIRSRVSRPRTE